MSGVGVGALAVYGLWRRDWLGAGLAALGGNLIFRGTTGHCFVYQAAGMNTAGTQAISNPEQNVRVESAAMCASCYHLSRPNAHWRTNGLAQRCARTQGSN